jgi:NAD(P)-dependent dehydrogenase (short-subunit alcohol dehydrogenase family)
MRLLPRVLVLMSALITGAAHGIGAATARILGAAGHEIIVSDIDLEAAEVVARQIVEGGGKASAHLLDVSSSQAWEKLADLLRATDRAPSIIINNAFSLERGAAHEISEESWNHQLSVNLSAVYRSMHIFHSDLVSSQGAVVNVASVHAIVARPTKPAYAASKGGVIALTRQLSIDYAPHVRVNCVIPGAIETRVWGDGGPETDRSKVTSLISLGRMGRPDEIASAIAFLAGNGASYITGASLVVDGGQSTWAEA